MLKEVLSVAKSCEKIITLLGGVAFGTLWFENLGK